MVKVALTYPTTHSSLKPIFLQSLSAHTCNYSFTLHFYFSPDEKALVEGAELYDYKFLARTPETVTIQTCSGEQEVYEVLNVIEFTSGECEVFFEVFIYGSRENAYDLGSLFSP